MTRILKIIPLKTKSIELKNNGITQIRYNIKYIALIDLWQKKETKHIFYCLKNGFSSKSKNDLYSEFSILSLRSSLANLQEYKVESFIWLKIQK